MDKEAINKCIFRKKMIYKKLFRSEKDFHENYKWFNGDIDLINIIFWRAEYEEFCMKCIVKYELDFSQIIFGFNKCRHKKPNYINTNDNDEFIVQDLISIESMADKINGYLKDLNLKYKEWCEVGEHYVDIEDHWSRNNYPTCGDCMECSKESEII